MPVRVFSALLSVSKIISHSVRTGCLLLLTGYLVGQNAYRFNSFTTSDGLPSSYTHALACDPTGFVWVSTQDGLARFDGHRFVAFDELRPKTPIAGKLTRSMVIDQAGYLWANADGSLYRIALSTYHVVAFTSPLTPECVGPNGICWFKGESCIGFFNAQQQSLDTFQLFWEGKVLKIGQICAGRESDLWISTNSGVFRFETRGRTLTRLQCVDPATQKLYCMQADPQGMLWLSAWNNMAEGLIKVDPYADKVLLTRGRQAHSITSTDVNDFLVLNDCLWMCTNEGGLCRYDFAADRFDCFSANNNAPGGIGANQMHKIIRDSFGNVWISSALALYRLPSEQRTTRLLAHDPKNANSLISSPATAILPVSDTLLAIGTQGGLSLYNRHRDAFRNIRLPVFRNNTYNNQITALAPAGDGKSIWIGSWATLSRLEVATGRLPEYHVANDNAGDNHPASSRKNLQGAARSLLLDARGNFWFIGYFGQLTRMPSGKTDLVLESVHLGTPKNQGLNTHAYCMLDLQENGLLIGTMDGLVRYNPVADSVSSLPVSFPGADSTVWIKSLSRAKNGDVLVIADNKPFRYTYQQSGGRAVPLSGFPFPDKCRQIIEGLDGSLWITVEGGIYRLVEKTGFWQFFDTHFHLNDNGFSQIPSVPPVIDASGNLYFCGSRGVSIISPALFDHPQVSAPVLKIVGIKSGEAYLPTDSACHLLHAIRLPYDRSDLSFEFALLNSPVPELNRFAYRLGTGDWVDMGSNRIVHFSRLAPGAYELQVKAANSDGVWVPEPVTLRMVISPPWWRSVWAIIGYVLLVGWGVYAFYRFRLRQRLAIQETEQLRQLDAFKSRFFTNITHEFRTPLTVILGATDQLEEAAGQAQSSAFGRQVALIRRNSENLLRLINQILDLARVDNNALNIQYIQGDVLAYLRYLSESLHSLANSRNVMLRVESPEAAIVMDYDPERLQQIVYNLLSNAVKFTPSGGKVVMRVTKSSGLTVSVQDTGVGIPPEDLPHIFDRFFQAKNQEHNKAGGTGIGLSLTRELVRAMGGTIHMDSTPGGGTTATVTLPLTNTAPMQPVPTPVHPPVSLPMPGATTPDAEEGRPLVLLMEDNPDVVEYLIACLAPHYRLSFAYNGRAGIETALETVPDMIVSDVMMPEKDGLDVLDALKNDTRTSHIPIVLLTAKATVEERLAGLRRGADAYLVKPFNREELLSVLSNLNRLQQQQQQLLRRKWALEPGAAPLPEKPSAPPVDALEDAFLSRLRAVVEENIGRADLSMDDLSRAMTMSYPNLHRKLTALTRLSPVQFIRTLRMQRAKQLLLDTDKPIGEIAFEVGFNDPRYFSRVFSEEFGRSPSAMRESSTS
ncbi:MAG: ATP-binding protein [Saprospiraceae bacterium]|nr:ATP-binding protein [Saprospiraceae bacterium]